MRLARVGFVPPAETSSLPLLGVILFPAVAIGCLNGGLWVVRPCPCKAA